MPRSCPRSDEETKWQVTRRLTSVEELATDDNGAPETITSSSRLVRRPIRIIDSLLSRRNSQMSNTRRESIFHKYFDQTEDREWARYRRFLPCYFLEISKYILSIYSRINTFDSLFFDWKYAWENRSSFKFEIFANILTESRSKDFMMNFLIYVNRNKYLDTWILIFYF